MHGFWQAVRDHKRNIMFVSGLCQLPEQNESNITKVKLNIEMANKTAQAEGRFVK